MTSQESKNVLREVANNIPTHVPRLCVSNIAYKINKAATASILRQFGVVFAPAIKHIARHIPKICPSSFSLVPADNLIVEAVSERIKNSMPRTRIAKAIPAAATLPPIDRKRI